MNEINLKTNKPQLYWIFLTNIETYAKVSLVLNKILKTSSLQSYPFLSALQKSNIITIPQLTATWFLPPLLPQFSQSRLVYIGQ